MRDRNVIFQPNNHSCVVKEGENLLQIAQREQIFLNADCAANGSCGKCRVKILAGYPGQISDDDKNTLTEQELHNGLRLACRVVIEDDLVVEVVQVKGESNRKKHLLKFPESFRPQRKCHATTKYGLAIDIGTTTIVGMFWNLTTGQLVNVEAETNPQAVFGSDVISRILFCTQKSENLFILQKNVIDCINGMIQSTQKICHIIPKEIVEVTVVGNSTMSHLFLGIDPQSLARSPFLPAYYGAVDKKAYSLALQVNPDADVHVLPGIAGHVGADTVGVMLATNIKQYNGVSLVIDIGTNGEVLCSNYGRIAACSTAAGPAFEGASIRHGMRAKKGAIEGIQITNKEVILQIIDVKDVDEESPGRNNSEAVGICGSGVIDVVAKLVQAKIIDKTGRLIQKEEALKKELPDFLTNRLIEGEKGMEFILVYRQNNEPITITQQDIRELQLAKGAIYAGILTLLKSFQLKKEDIDQFLIAGAFGNYINIESTLKIGLLPNIPIEKIITVGNAAGTGASMALLSEEIRLESVKMAADIKHIELSTNMEFQEDFVNALSF